MTDLHYRFKNRPFYEAATTAERGDLDPADADLVSRFAADGFVTFASGLADDVIDAAGAYVKRHCFSDDGDVVTRRLVNAWRECEPIRQIAGDSGIHAKLALLYGRRPIPFQTLNFSIGSEQRTHSDAVHFNTVPSRFMCGVWLALEDIHADSGPLHYFRGSHRLADTSLYDTFDGSQSNSAFPSLDDYYRCYEDYVMAALERAGYQREEALIKRGDVFVWSAGLCHGGSPRTNLHSTRLSQVVHFFFDDCVYYSPRRSHPQLGRLWLRKVRDITFDKDVAHVFGGKRFDVYEAGPYCFDETAAPINVAKMPAHLRWARAARGVVKSLFVR